MSISRTADVFYTYRFIRILTTKWEDMEAYELGIIDENGENLKKTNQLKTTEEKDAYTIFHRLVFNIKRLLEKLPFGKSKLASYAAALFLLKENTDLSEEQIEDVMRSIFKEYGVNECDMMSESVNCSERQIIPGVYRLCENAIMPSTGEDVIPAGSKVMVSANSAPVGTILGVDIYEAKHVPTGKTIYITAQGIK